MESKSSVPIRRAYVEKRSGFDVEAARLREEFIQSLSLETLGSVRVLRRYDVAGLSEEEFRRVAGLVLAELQCDELYLQIPPPLGEGDRAVAVEYLPGQYDQRSDSAEQCAQLVVGSRPRIRSATVYALGGRGGRSVSDTELERIGAYLVNPVDSCLASLELPERLDPPVQAPESVPTLAGFRDLKGSELGSFCADRGLAMSAEDLETCRDYFRTEGRDPSITELRVLDTYWSDHCRHTTFTTALEDIEILEGTDASALKAALELYDNAREEVYGKEGAALRGRSLMDLATLGAKVLRKRGLLEDLDLSEEINACSIKVRAEFADGSSEPWLLMFKNETHNHPTEIEPFGGAATCLGGAIRDPLSGRAYVHQAMRVTGAADPRASLADTLPGKLSQSKLARGAAAGYSSYGNQIGIATGQVSEFYHPGFLAKRMELGAVIAGAPASQVRREAPSAGDVVILVGGRTGRDGIGGATGSSKAHTEESVQSAGAEVQKGNAVEERKLQRLFRNPKAAALIKRCNDFGAGGVSVAIGELARGLDIDLDAVPRKYEGLDGTELAISESQERMAVVVSAADAADFVALATGENLEATPVATVSSGDRLRMRWRGGLVVDLDRNFLDRNGAPRSAKVRIVSPSVPESERRSSGYVPDEGSGVSGAPSPEELAEGLRRTLSSLEFGSRKGLQERFDGSIGAGSVLFPWAGATQGTPECGMAALLPSLGKESLTASLMTFAYDPTAAVASPFKAARGAVLEALAKFACLGGDPFAARLSLQEYFEKTSGPEAWGKPAAALLGALEAQLALGVPAIGGKDSMSGSYSDPGSGIELRVPPTLVAFAAGCERADRVLSGALSGPGGTIIALPMAETEEGNPDWKLFRENMGALRALARRGLVRSARPSGPEGVAASLATAAFGNRVGFELDVDALQSLIADTAGASWKVADDGAPTDGASGAPRSAQTRTEPRAVLPVGSVLLELDSAAFALCSGEAEGLLSRTRWTIVARTVGGSAARFDSAARGSAELPLDLLRRAWESPLTAIYPQTGPGLTTIEAEERAPAAALDLPSWTGGDASARATGTTGATATPEGTGKDDRPDAPAPRASRWRAGDGAAAPLVLLPAFPGTNCEWDMERAFRKAGARTQVFVFRNRSPEETLQSIGELAEALGKAQILALSGGFSAGDEPDGSGKFIANVLRSPSVADALMELLGRRDGLTLGICNGFQALIKVGLVPYGELRDASADMPTLTFNTLGRHVSRMVRTRVMSNRSPWLALDEVGSIHTLPVSHGEGRLTVDQTEGRRLLAEGLVATCYVDEEGLPTMAEPYNPNGSAFAVEGLTSPDGRVFGKMAHSERVGDLVHRNIPGDKVQRIFEAGVRYFS